MKKEDITVTSIDELKDGGAIINITMTDEIYKILNNAALQEKLTLNNFILKIFTEYINELNMKENNDELE